MDFNIYYLLIAVTVASTIGCAVGIRIGRIPFRFGKLQAATLSTAAAGFLATLVLLAREAEHGSHDGAGPVVASVIIALPFLILGAASMLARIHKYEVSAFVLAAVFALAGTGIYYYFFEIEKDEYAGLLLLLVVPVEFVAALIQLGLVFMERKKPRNKIRVT